jgi:hypothetical protein
MVRIMFNRGQVSMLFPASVFAGEGLDKNLPVPRE